MYCVPVLVSVFIEISIFISELFWSVLMTDAGAILQDSSENSASQTSKIGSSSRRVCLLSLLCLQLFHSCLEFKSHYEYTDCHVQAFTGSIVEHSHGLTPIQSTKSTTADQVP